MGLFSGIGGFELAFARHGAECVGMCEIDAAARTVLQDRFLDVPLYGDVEQLKSLNDADIVTAGFPCQDLSQAGSREGIKGSRSVLIDQVFRLIREAPKKPEWVVLENVSYMLKLKRGNAMLHIIEQAEALGYNWAYRVLDARCFGLPQRRERVVILLSRSHDPAQVLFPTGTVQPNVDDHVGTVVPSSVYGFYWTEGKRGLGWVKDAVPTIKGGSTLGIASPPAIWDPSTGEFGTPSINDAERMFGFASGWTEAAAAASSRAGTRWKLVGNTICVPMVEWICEQIMQPRGLGAPTAPLKKTERLPLIAAFGLDGNRRSVDVSKWAVASPPPELARFLVDPLKPLSVRAASGFYKRALETTTIRFADGFLDSLASYIERAAALSR